MAFCPFLSHHIYYLQSNDDIEDMIRTQKPTLWSKTINKSTETHFEQSNNDEIIQSENVITTEDISLDIINKSQVGENNIVFKRTFRLSCSISSKFFPVI